MTNNHCDNTQCNIPYKDVSHKKVLVSIRRCLVGFTLHYMLKIAFDFGEKGGQDQRCNWVKRE